MNAKYKKSFLRKQKKENIFLLEEVKDLSENIKTVKRMFPSSERKTQVLDVMERIKVKLQTNTKEDKQVRDLLIVHLPLLYIHIYKGLLKTEE